ncbi:CDP-glycerol:poly(glycerophosphate) glycerophosphotransferase [Micromonospora pattaloongensis]|uniref:CDP-glycerol:poly(Glycerophosphate) glycerophosphotransferase n=1 Tax=Micromonospora pattaloongensis TaxID=405436 RepID=A0A1H3SKT2_9ACTN|nr:bifunctional glycosyltransferase family 2 protein/CDP-glycerol:glycerophosphate glycerophosphotransferase [Micromonospora pattaloongensis]SDZ38347.1 CDP-glycerol:poly(glycerophosphate) glycerophosphotransferase [Micromonospora pattaloongensis]
MPLISFVVPVYGVQGYLRECLDSILGQSFTDIEVIAVDDCSPDSSGEILAEYAARDARLRVITLGCNGGQGPARNRGLAEATGRYVWFVDSDDWLAEGALRAVVERLRATDPDVLIVDHARVHWHGRVDPSGPGRRFHLAPPVFTLAQWPDAIDILHVSWNKVVRRSLLARLGFAFRAGWYEDVPFTYQVLLAADRIALLDRICVNYRQRRRGAATRTPGDGHFAIFPSWAEVFDRFDDSRPGAERLRALLFRRMIWHFLKVRGNDSRLSPALRGRFFAEMTTHYRRCLPAGGYPCPTGIEGLKHRLVAGGRHRTFGALRLGFRVNALVTRALAGAVRRVSKPGRGALRRLRDVIVAVYYRACRWLPIDSRLALYAAYWYRGYACNPAAIYEKARELVPDVRGVWVVRRDRVDALPDGVAHVVAGSPAYYRALARAKWLINNVNWPNGVVKRPGSVHVMTHHGTPLKVMGLDQQAYPGGVRDPDFAGQLRRAGRWDFSVTANSFTTQMWERAYPCRYRTLETGYPRNDRLARATAADVAAARTRLRVAPDERVVLYAPTHREHHPGYHPPFDPEEFVEALGPRGRLLMRSHYFRDRAGPGPAIRPSARVRDVSAHPSVEEICLAADVLVTDYSSLMFDYAILDRPIVIYAPDWQAYRLVRGVYFDITAEPPGAVALTFPDLLDLFRTGSADDDAAAKARSQFRRRFCALEDGRAAERVVRRVLLDEAG